MKTALWVIEKLHSFCVDWKNISFCIRCNSCESPLRFCMCYHHVRTPFFMAADKAITPYLIKFLLQRFLIKHGQTLSNSLISVSPHI